MCRLALELWQRVVWVFGVGCLILVYLTLNHFGVLLHLKIRLTTWVTCGFPQQLLHCGVVHCPAERRWLICIWWWWCGGTWSATTCRFGSNIHINANGPPDFLAERFITRCSVLRTSLSVVLMSLMLSAASL